MYDMIGVTCSGHGDQKYIDAIRQTWKDIRDDSVPEFRGERVRFSGDTPCIPWKQATELMFKQLAVMKRVQGGG